MPPDTTDPADIKFYLFFMILADEAYANEYISNIDDLSNISVLIIMLVVGCCLILVLGMIMLMTWKTSTKITRTIHGLKDITN